MNEQLTETMQISQLETTIDNIEKTNNKFLSIYHNAKKYVAGVAAGFVLATALGPNASAQQAKLNAQLTRPDGSAAVGNVQITGDTTITDNTFTSPKTYILKNLTGIEDPLSNEKIVFGENPTYDGNINIIFQNYQNIEGTLRAVDLIGRDLGKIDLKNQNQLEIANAPNQIFLKYTSSKHNETLKIINLANTFIANIFTEQTATVGIKPIGKTKGIADNDYIFNFTDPTANINNLTQNMTVLPGETYNLTQMLDWTIKQLIYSSRTNTNTTIKAVRVSDGVVLDERMAANGIFANRTLNERFNNETGLQVKYELTAPYTDPAVIVQNQFDDIQAVLDTIRLAQYNITVTGNGTTYTVRTSGQTVASNSVGVASAFKRQADALPLEVIVTRIGYNSSTTNLNMNKGVLTTDIQLTPAQYNHVVNGTATSSIAGKTIKDGTRMYLIVDPEGDGTFRTDSLFATTTNGNYTFTWSDNNSIISTKIGSAQVPGHQANSVVRNIDDSENVALTFTGISYSAIINLLVQNQYAEAVSSATITGGAAPVSTNTSGRAVVTRNNLSTDVNNVVFSSYNLPLTITRTNIQTLNTNVTHTAGTNAEQLRNVIQEYMHLLNINALSSIAGKTIRNGTEIYAVKDITIPADTLWTTTTNGNATFTWTDTKRTETTKAGSRSVPGHQPNEISFTMDDSENRSITYTGLIYSFTHPVHVVNQTSQDVPNATISGGTTPVNTNTTGRANITRTNLPTDANNLPLANYVTTLTISKSNIQTLNTSITSIVGTNPEALRQIIQEYEHFLYGNATTPEGTLVQGWRGGSPIHTATVNGSNYETNRIKRTTPTFTLDSLTFTRNGYMPQRSLNVILTEGGNQREATLQQTTTPTVHNFRILPKTIHGDAINTLTLDFKWADGTTTHHSVQPDGYIYVNRTEYSNPTTHALVTHASNINKYGRWQFFRRDDMEFNPADTNYAQNPKYDTEELPREETPLLLTGVPSLRLYLSNTKVKTPGYLLDEYPEIYQDSIRVDDQDVRNMMGQRLGGAVTKFMPRPGAETLYIFQTTFNETTGAPIEQTHLNRAKAELDKITTLLTLNDGIRLINSEFYLINSYTDSKWLEAQARDTYDNVLLTNYASSSAINGVVHSLSYSINNKARIKNSYSKYNTGTGNSLIFAEQFEQTTNLGDSDITLGSATHTLEIDGTVSALGKEIFRLTYFLNTGTTIKKIR
jgi:hypothetical protein